MKDAKYKYKLAIKDAANEFKSWFDDEILDSYLDRNFNKFWKLWKNKVHAKYADDTYLLVAASNSPSIPQEIQHIANWATANNLKLNNSVQITGNDCPSPA